MKAGGQIGWSVRDQARSLLKYDENNLGCITTEASSQRTKAENVNQGKS